MTMLELLGLLAVVGILASSVAISGYFIWLPSSLATTQEQAAVIALEACEDPGQMHIFHVKDLVRVQ